MTGEAYVWTIAAVRRGSTVITLGWADRQHRELRSLASDTVRTVIR
jgi:hypothetical protein